ncbi:hypothetical protein CPB85DRAFT_678400 [Mucidula mucida]|nr:hypothetical protein CPB85DRAFT_678400 [Mucidula mucida]
MHSLRSRTRLSSSSPQSPDSSVDCDISDTPSPRLPEVDPSPRLRILRVLGLVLSGISLLLFIAVSTLPPQHILETESPKVLVKREIPVTSPPVPTIYRDFLAHLSTKPEKAAKNPWPPSITRIPITDKKFLIPGYIGEQESKARIHFQDMHQLARTLDRILVLPNVGQSRLGMCRDYAFDMYYDASGLQGVMTMDDFRWLVEDDDRLNAQLILVGRNPKEYFPQCMPDFDIFPSSPVRAGKDNLTSLLGAQTADVLIVNWDLRYPVFSTTTPLHYSPELRRLSETIEPPKPYVMVHWRMETIPASALVPCARALLGAIHDSGISTVWFASDYPFSLQESGDLAPKSSTFRNFGEDHRRAVGILMTEPGLDVRHLEGTLDIGTMDTGVLGILDKLVGIKADVFISGAEGCGRKSSFTRQIVEGRKAAWATRQHMLNVVDYFASSS